MIPAAGEQPTSVTLSLRARACASSCPARQTPPRRNSSSRSLGWAQHRSRARRPCTSGGWCAYPAVRAATRSRNTCRHRRLFQCCNASCNSYPARWRRLGQGNPRTDHLPSRIFMRTFSPLHWPDAASHHCHHIPTDSGAQPPEVEKRLISNEASPISFFTEGEKCIDYICFRTGKDEK